MGLSVKCPNGPEKLSASPFCIANKIDEPMPFSIFLMQSWIASLVVSGDAMENARLMIVPWWLRWRLIHCPVLKGSVFPASRRRSMPRTVEVSAVTLVIVAV